MKQPIALLLVFLLLLCGSGCVLVLPGAPVESSAPTSLTATEPETAAPVSSRTETAEPTELTQPEPVTEPITEPVPETTEAAPYLSVNEAGKTVVHVPGPRDERPAYAYTFQPYAFSSIDTLVYGEAFEEEFRGFCDAVLAGEDSFPCTGFDNWLHIQELKDDLLPFSVYVSVYDPGIEVGDLYSESLLQDGRYPLYYLIPKEEFRAVVEQFKSRIAELIAQADLREGDSDLEKALKLYTASSLRIAYEDRGGAMKINPALMEDYGICQNIARAYEYLLLQAGVDAGTCWGSAKDDSYAHAWTLIKLDGKWYHADVTWQLDEPYSLRHFLCTDQERDAEGLDVPYFNINALNLLWHRDFPVDDASWADLREVRWYAIDHASGCISCYDDPLLDYYDLSTYQLERKTLPLR